MLLNVFSWPSLWLNGVCVSVCEFSCSWNSTNSFSRTLSSVTILILFYLEEKYKYGTFVGIYDYVKLAWCDLMAIHCTHTCTTLLHLSTLIFATLRYILCQIKKSVQRIYLSCVYPLDTHTHTHRYFTDYLRNQLPLQAVTVIMLILCICLYN